MALFPDRVTSEVLLPLFLLTAASIRCRKLQQVEPGDPAEATSEPRLAEPPAPLNQATQANPTQEQGSTHGTESGVGEGGQYGADKPSPFGSRKLGPSSKKASGGGATQNTEKAVLDGLRWLARHQNPDGSWSALALKSRCPADKPCYDDKLAKTNRFDVGLTGLALLCFLDAGFSHESKQDLVDLVKDERHKIGDIVKRGLNWLHDHQKADGSFTPDRPFMYNEALATMAMAKAFQLSPDRYWREPAQKGIEFIEAAQRVKPTGDGPWGWRYESRTEIQEDAGDLLHSSDTSVTTWCVMALESGRLAGLQVKPESMQGAMDYCKFVTADNGLVGYMDAKSAGATVTGPYSEQFTYHPSTMLALGMCLRIFATHNADDPFLGLAARRIAQDLPTVSKDHKSIDYYYWYCGSLALNQLDGPDSPKRTGKYWNPWNKAMIDAVISLQDHTQRACSNGGWILSDRWGNYSAGGPLFNTAMNVLTLETFYAYERSLRVQARVGTVAPELRLIDDQGSVFTLSDYRGSVVLLDFWRPDAAGPDTYVESRMDLLTRVQGKAFVLLTLALRNDSIPEGTERLPSPELRRVANWRCSQLISRDDPICRELGLDAPTSVVVDSTGTIRAAGRDWPNAMAFVERMLDETEQPPKPK